MSVLPTREEDALTPRDVHTVLNGTISADNVRTILSRLKGSKAVAAFDGKYWRIPPPPHHDAENAVVVDDDWDIDALIGAPPPPPQSDDDLSK